MYNGRPKNELRHLLMLEVGALFDKIGPDLVGIALKELFCHFERAFFVILKSQAITI